MTEARQSGQVIGGKYLLERVLGAGGMGEVWSARHTSLQTNVALKFLKGSSAAQPEIRSRFELEARVTAQLKTRLAVQVFDYGVADRGEPFLVMELLEGESVAQRLHRFGRFTIPNALNLLTQAGRALEKAHALGIVHRDFKPGNIFITVDEDYREQVKVMDFGLAKIMGELEVQSAATEALDDGASPSTFTRTGALLGTPSYMSPEQVAGSSQIGPPTDLWALGVVAYECLTGQVPFVGGKLSDLFESIKLARHTKGSTLVPELGDGFDQWFAKICALEPSQRFDSAVTAVNELSKALGQPVPHDSGSFSRGQAASFASLQAVTPMPRLTPPPGGQTLDDEGSEPTLRREPSKAPGVPTPVSAAERTNRTRLIALGGVLVGVSGMWLWSALREKQAPPPVSAPVTAPANVAPALPPPPPPPIEVAKPPEPAPEPVKPEVTKPAAPHKKVAVSKPVPVEPPPPEKKEPAVEKPEKKKPAAGTTIDSTPELGI